MQIQSHGSATDREWRVEVDINVPWSCDRLLNELSCYRAQVSDRRRSDGNCRFRVSALRDVDERERLQGAHQVHELHSSGEARTETVPPVLLVNMTELILTSRAATRSEGSSPTLTWSAALAGLDPLL